MNEPPEPDSLMHDLWRESCNSWAATARWGQVMLIAGLATLAAFTFLPPLLPHDVLAWIRILSYAALMAGVVESLKALDEFYMRVYAYSAAFAAVSSSVILFAAYELRWPLASEGTVVITATFGIGFVYTFARLRRP